MVSRPERETWETRILIYVFDREAQVRPAPPERLIELLQDLLGLSYVVILFQSLNPSRKFVEVCLRDYRLCHARVVRHDLAIVISWSLALAIGTAEQFSRPSSSPYMQAVRLPDR